MTDAQTVKVKPLVWLPYPNKVFAGPDIAIADAPFNHRYQVQRDPSGSGYTTFLHPRLPITSSTLWWEDKDYPTLEAAKTAAQADYEARILSAIVSTDLPLHIAAALEQAQHKVRATVPGNMLVRETERICAAIRALTPDPHALDRVRREARLEGMREAADVCPAVIQNYGIMKPGTKDQFASREAQICAKGFVRLVEEEIRALIAAEERASEGEK